MSRLGVFVDRQTLGNSEQLTSLIRLRDSAEEMGHMVYFIFPTEIAKIGKVDGLFIRSRTDPMNISFVAAKMAEMRGIPVIDDPASIQVCSDKVNMYLHLIRDGVRIPDTVFVKKGELTERRARDLFRELGSPLILKEPSTSFSLRVEKVNTVAEFLKTGKRFIKLSDWIVAQRFIESNFDWRVGVLDGEPLYACQYIIPQETFKIQATVNGHIVYCAVKGMPLDGVPAPILDIAVKAGRAIGKGLYGVDIKDRQGTPFVIEVNDNPSLEGGEDEQSPGLYRKIIAHLLGDSGGAGAGPASTP
ncbi:MAG TPA: RimK family alpha-L-glutamate ligase [Methanomicrobiales archaeon]|nr:RimK family alpha-L-glutamate ligase [Methanomicrobiales archaeon]